MASLRKLIFESKEATRPPRSRGLGGVLLVLLVVLCGGALYFVIQDEDSLNNVLQFGEGGDDRNLRYEIVYYSARNCAACKTWRNTHFEDFKQSDLARFVAVTTRNAKCGSFGAGAAGSIYARTCHALFGEQRGSKKLGFALIDRQERKVLSSGRGLEGFNLVVDDARAYLAGLTGSDANPLLPAEAPAEEKAGPADDTAHDGKAPGHLRDND